MSVCVRLVSSHVDAFRRLVKSGWKHKQIYFRVKFVVYYLFFTLKYNVKFRCCIIAISSKIWKAIQVKTPNVFDVLLDEDTIRPPRTMSKTCSVNVKREHRSRRVDHQHPGMTLGGTGRRHREDSAEDRVEADARSDRRTTCRLAWNENPSSPFSSLQRSNRHDVTILNYTSRKPVASLLHHHPIPLWPQTRCNYI